MDDYNMKDLIDLFPATAKAKVELLGHYNNSEIIVDPYFVSLTPLCLNRIII